MSSYAVVNPATGQTIKQYPTLSDEELESSIARASAAHATWSTGPTVGERTEVLGCASALLIERSRELGLSISQEMGKPVRSAVGEVKFSASIFEYYAEHAESLLADVPLDVTSGEGSAFLRSTSLGVLLGIMPWNYPYYQVARFVAPNLAAGNTILLKHSSQCPESAAAIEKLLHEAGVPTDAYINLYATADQVSQVIADPRVQGVSLTGSERAGSAIAEQAGRHLKKVVLELGGSDPFIVLSASDLDSVVDDAVSARMSNAGQACNAAKRFIVIEQLYEPFLQKVIAKLSNMAPGDPTDENVRFGPLSSSAAAEGLEDQVRRAVAEGATLALGGGRHENFFEATVLTDIAPDNEAGHEEFFGPVALVYKAESESGAVELANDTPFGLGSFVISDDRDQAMRVADQINAGMVFINAVGAEGPELPFGGVKASGFGRELGALGISEFVNKKLHRLGG